MIKISVLTAILSFCFFNGLAQVEKIDTDRPDQTESTVTMPKKWVQLEFGFSKQKNGPGSYSFEHPTLLTKYGLTKRLELRLITTIGSDVEETPNQPKETIVGLEPVEIGARLALWEEKKWVPKTSLLFHFAIPALASKKLRADKLAPNFRLSMQNTINKLIGIAYNIGAEWDGYSNDPRWLYTLSPGFNIGENWYAYIEAFGFISKQNAPENSIDGGIAYYISSDCKVDLSSGFGISSAAPGWYIAAGISVRFKTGK